MMLPSLFRGRGTSIPVEAAAASGWSWAGGADPGEEVQAVLAQMHQGQGDGVLAPGSMALNIPGFILEATAQRVLPMFHAAFWVERGALASGPIMTPGRQAARLVDKILKGAKPAEIPVEGTQIEFVISWKTAHAWGLQSRQKPCFRPTGSFVNLAGAVTCAAGRGSSIVGMGRRKRR